MKKIFTLIAVALMAVGANAQGKYGLIKESGAITAGTQITSVDNIVMTFGDAGAAEFKDPKGDNKLNELLGATGFTEGNGTNGNKDKGTIYYFEAKTAGTLTVGAVINADKGILVKKDNYSGEDVAFRVFDYEGNEVTVTDNKISDKTYGTIVVNIESGVKYAIGLAGSKMGYYGFKFETGATGINSVKATTEDSSEYNLAGQQVDKNYKGVVVKNGKKMIQK